MRASLPEHPRALEAGCAVEPGANEGFSFGGGRYTIGVANDLESRRKAYGLVYRLYREKEYAKPHPSKMWLSIFDALPETATLLVERTAVEGGGWKVEGQGDSVEGGRLKVEGRSNPATSTFDPPPSTFHLPPPSPSLRPPPSTASTPVGALTVVFDSPLGLPADKLYKPELDALRAKGRRLSEIVSLGVAEDSGAGSEILVKLFNFVYLVSKKVRGATDFVITVNPRHVRFYEKTLLFEPAGAEREYDKVGGAPALLLRLDLDVPEERVRLEHGPAETRPPRSRTLYPMFHAPEAEPVIVARLAASLRPMTGREFDYFFVAKTDLLERAAPEERSFIRERYPFPEPEAVSPR